MADATGPGRTCPGAWHRDTSSTAIPLGAAAFACPVPPCPGAWRRDMACADAAFVSTSCRIGSRGAVACRLDGMPRPHRIQAAGLYHVMTRGNAGDPVFGAADDRDHFLALAERVVTDFAWRCQAYCVLTNHYHLLVAVPEATLSLGMQWLNGTYARAYNRRHWCEDHVFGKRFRSVAIEGQGHLLEVVRYIARNPVRAGICERPRDWRWSSFAAVAGLIRKPRFLAADDVLALFGQRPEPARRRFVDFVDDVTV